MIGLVLFSLCLYPQLLLGRDETYHVGMAGPVPEVRTYSLVVLGIAVVGLLASRGSLMPWTFLPFLAWLVLGLTVAWQGNSEQWAGVLQFVLGVSAWAVGTMVGRRIERDGRFGRLLACCVGTIVAVQLLVSLLQLTGVPINPLRPADAALLGHRVNGTLNHPNTLGKVLVALLVLALPLTRSRDALTRRLASGSVLIALVPLALAGGRANFLGAVAMIVVWTVLLPPEETPGVRAWILLGTLVVGLSFLGIFLARFSQDPTGGVRSQINAIALGQIPQRPVFGTGPNSYVTVIGPLSGSYIPVHNTFLLAAAELGLPGAALFLAPFVALFHRARRLRRRHGYGGDCARALLASIPPLLLITMTGWAMLGNVALPLWMFVLALSASRLPAKRPPEPPVKQASPAPQRPRPLPVRSARTLVEVY